MYTVFSVGKTWFWKLRLNTAGIQFVFYEKYQWVFAVLTGTNWIINKHTGLPLKFTKKNCKKIRFVDYFLEGVVAKMLEFDLD